MVCNNLLSRYIFIMHKTNYYYMNVSIFSIQPRFIYAWLICRQACYFITLQQTLKALLIWESTLRNIASHQLSLALKYFQLVTVWPSSPIVRGQCCTLTRARTLFRGAHPPINTSSSSSLIIRTLSAVSSKQQQKYYVYIKYNLK